MTTIRDWDGVERHVRYRRIPGYYNRSTYHVDVDHQHVMTVKRISDSTWNNTATWRAYEPGIPNNLGHLDSEVIGTDSTRERVVKTAWRRIQTKRAS